MNAWNESTRALFETLMKGIRGDWTKQQDWFSNLLKSTGSDLTGRLGGTLGGQLGRMNVPIPAGTESLATKYLAPITSQLGTIGELTAEPQISTQLNNTISLMNQISAMTGGKAVDLEMITELLKELGQKGRGNYGFTPKY